MDWARPTTMDIVEVLPFWMTILLTPVSEALRESPEILTWPALQSLGYIYEPVASESACWRRLWSRLL